VQKYIAIIFISIFFGANIRAQTKRAINPPKHLYSGEELIHFGDSILRVDLHNDLIYNLMIPNHEQSKVSWIVDTVVNLPLWDRTVTKSTKHENHYRTLSLQKVTDIKVPFKVGYYYSLRAPGHPGITSPCSFVLEFDSTEIIGKFFSSDLIPGAYNFGVLSTDFKNYRTAFDEALLKAETILKEKISNDIFLKSFHLERKNSHVLKDGPFFITASGDSLFIPLEYEFRYAIHPIGFDSLKIPLTFTLDRFYLLWDSGIFNKFIRELPSFIREGKHPQFITSDEAVKIAREHGLPETIENKKFRPRLMPGKTFVWNVVSVEKIENFGRGSKRWHGKQTMIDALTGKFIRIDKFESQEGCVTPD
jgi:hypothetical protein